MASDTDRFETAVAALRLVLGSMPREEAIRAIRSALGLVTIEAHALHACGEHLQRCAADIEKAHTQLDPPAGRFAVDSMKMTANKSLRQIYLAADTLRQT